MISESLVPICEIAHGGMGAVTLCVRSEGSFRRLYAVKRLHPHLRSDPGVRAMFLDEARLSGLIRHPNVVSVLDVGEDAQGPLLVMDFVDGISVASILAQTATSGEPLPLQFCLAVCLDTARGLHAAHELKGADGAPLGLVHRDVSPHNILVGFDGIVRVTDFGIAKAFGNATKTSSGVLKGSSGYMSPEQLRFDEPDRRSDLFSMGIVLYELLAGRQLYAASPGPEAARRILTEPSPDIGDLRDDVPPAVTELLFRMLAKTSDERPRSAAEIAASLEAALIRVLRDETRLDTATLIERRFGHLRLSRRPEVAAALAKVDRGTRPRRVLRVPVFLGLVILAVVGLMAIKRQPGEVSLAAPVGTGSVPTGLSRSIWAGAWHTCASHANRLRCWGKNNEGQLGIGTAIDELVPHEVLGPITNVIGADGGNFHTCVVRAAGDALCFGRNSEGQLGTGDTKDAVIPVMVKTSARFLAIGAGDHHTCAVTTTGQLFCWGQNAAGQLGDGTTVDRHEPTRVKGMTDVVAVSAGGNTTCALGGSGVFCWGDLTFELPGRTGAQPFATAVPRTDDVVEIGVGGRIICVRKRDGQVACWGNNDHGHLGDGTTVGHDTPVDVPGLDRVVQLAVGRHHACALRDQRGVKCWGHNLWGNLGIGSSEDAHRPTPLPELVDVLAVAIGAVHTCASLLSGGVVCWGHNDSGQIGDSTIGKNRHRPVSVTGFY